MEYLYACVILMAAGVNQGSLEQARRLSTLWNRPQEASSEENTSLERLQYTGPSLPADRPPRPFLAGRGALRPPRRVQPFLVPSNLWNIPRKPMSNKMQPVLPFAIPMNVQVVIDSGSIIFPPKKISVTLSPDMSVMDALSSAESEYAATRGGRDFDNPYSVSLHASVELGCITIGGVGGLTSNGAYKWKIIVYNSRHLIEYTGFCVPGESMVKIRGGYIVALSRRAYRVTPPKPRPYYRV